MMHTKKWSLHIRALLAWTAAFCGAATASKAQLYLPPAGGWTYVYTGDLASPADADGEGDPIPFTALDGTWDHDNGSDAWDESAIGTGSPGGATGGLTDGAASYLRLQDTGNPTRYQMPDPSNRKMFFGHDITAEGASDTILDDGITLSFRARIATGDPVDDLHPDVMGGLIGPWPVDGDGYLVHDGGKGNFTIKQASGGGIAFALANAAAGSPGNALLMNNLNGTSVTGTVDSGEAGTPNLLLLDDPTAWNEFWITIQDGGAGTHQVSVYQDGSLVPTVFDVTAGNGSDFDDISYIAMGVGSTGQSGAIDIDFFGWAPGVTAPVPEPSSFALAIAGLIGLLAVVLRHRAQC